MSMTEEIVLRITAAKVALQAKGYKVPTVEVGIKVMGDYGDVCWGTIHLGSPKNWCDGYTYETLEGALDAIDASIPNIPSKSEQDAVLATAQSKLTPAERDALLAAR